MLCFDHQSNKFGEICTNKCSHRQKCTNIKASFLIEATDILASEIISENTNGVYVTSFVPYCSAPEAYINGVINDYYKNER